MPPDSSPTQADMWNPRGPTNTTQAILDRARDRNPDHIYALVSGGHDSDTTLHVTHHDHPIELDGVVHIDTGIGVPETRDFVEDRCNELGLEFIAIGSDYRLPHEEYESLVTRFGFPGPGVHRWMYLNLKGKPLQRFVNEHTGDVMLISGVRQAESRNRMENIEPTGIQEKDNATWVSPLLAWSDEKVTEYRREHDLPDNPVVTELHMSGECLCGAYADRLELEILKIFYPDTARAIEYLEMDVLEQVERGDINDLYALWGNGSLSQGELAARIDGHQSTLPLCTDCEDRCSDEPYSLDGNPLTYSEAALRDPDFEFNQNDFYCVPCGERVSDGRQHRKQAHPFDDDTAAEEWDIRRIDTLESNRREAVITEPDPEKSPQPQCAVEHDWQPASGGVHECMTCGAFNLSKRHTTTVDAHSHDTSSSRCTGTCTDCSSPPENDSRSLSSFA